MTKTLTPAKTPGVAIARILRGLGLKQGLDFGVRAVRKNGERIGTRVAVFSRPADQTMADNADKIEQLAGDAGFHFNVSIYFTPSGIVWVHVANYGEKTRQTHFLSPVGRTEQTAEAPQSGEVQILAVVKEAAVRDFPKGQRVQGVDNYGVTCMGTVNGVAWGVMSLHGDPNYGDAWVDVDWDEMPHNRGTGRRSRPFTSGLIKH